MDLSTTYLGMKLPHPFVVGASPLSDDLDTARRLEDAGAAALVMRSLFAEQIEREEVGRFLHLEPHGESFAEALSYFPSPERFMLGPDDYLAHLRRLKQALGIPVIASLNGVSPGPWLQYASLMEEAGADALELNLYHLPTDATVSGADVEANEVEVVREIKRRTKLPVAVKLSPFYTALPNFVRRLESAGANGVVIFNRFYQPDIDPEALEVVPSLQLSRTSELLMRLRWLAILAGRTRVSLAATGGVHDAVGTAKAIMAGAHVVQLVSTLLARGPDQLQAIRHDFAEWMAQHEYDALGPMRGSMSLVACPDPGVYERANYMMILQSWRER